MMSLWDALRMNKMISYQELVRTFPKLMSDKEINNRSDLKNFSKVFFKECLSSGKSEYENHLSEKEHALRYNY